MMRTTHALFLTIAGFLGLLMAFCFEARRDGQTSVLRIGLPDGSFVWETTPAGQASGVHVLSWSFAILVASVCALYYGVQLSWRKAPEKPSEEPVAVDLDEAIRSSPPGKANDA